MPIGAAPLFDLSSISIDTASIESPLTWSADMKTRRKLMEGVTQWLRAHPIRINDIPEVVVAREIFVRIHTVLLEPNPGVKQEVEYDVVIRQIDKDSRITGELRAGCLSVFDEIWCKVATLLPKCAAKHPPDDDA